MKSKLIAAQAFVGLLLVSMWSGMYAPANAATILPFCQKIDDRVVQVKNKTSTDARTLLSLPAIIQNSPVSPYIKSKQLAYDKVTEESIHGLEESAVTPGQKESIHLFKTQFRSIVTTKRLAHQKLVDQYKTVVNHSFNDHQTVISSITATRATNLQAAILRAQSSCSAHTTSDSLIQAKYNKEIRDAQVSFKNLKQPESLKYSAVLSANSNQFTGQELKISTDFNTGIRQSVNDLRKALKM